MANVHFYFPLFDHFYIDIYSATGTAETGVTSERNETDALAARTLVESKTHFRVTTRENPVDLINDDRPDIWCFFKEGIPMVF